MNQLPSNPFQAIIEAASKQAASALTTDTLHRHQQRKQNTTQARSVLADISGSMDESVGATTKYALLHKALSDPSLDWTHQQLIAFNSIVETVSHPSLLPQPSGSTALHRAILHIVPNRPIYTLVISDGQPDDKQACFAAADQLTGVIDVLYIGSDTDFEAIAFMRMLATRTGGRVMVRDLTKQPTLPPSVISGFLN